jgi:hypothetical protein
MQTFDPQPATLAVISAAIGYTMIAAGVAKKQLRWRRAPRCRNCEHERCTRRHLG